MPGLSEPELGALFAALADPTRRQVVRSLAGAEPVTASRLAGELPMSRQAIAKHLGALERAGLVEPRREGRETRYRLTPEPLDGAIAWMEEVGAIVKSRVFRCGDEAVLALVSGANRADEARLEEEFGAPVARADADFARAATGFSIGGGPPLGHPAPLRTLVDEDLLGYEVVWAAAGTPHAVFPIAPGELAELAGGRVVRLAAPAR